MTARENQTNNMNKIEEIKYLLYYGKSKDEKINLNTDGWQIDYAIEVMFDFLKNNTRFDAPMVEPHQFTLNDKI